MRICQFIMGIVGVCVSACGAKVSDNSCQSKRVQSAKYVICQFNPANDNIRLHSKGSGAEVYGDFDPLNTALTTNSETLVFAMNGGMYHANRDPVGLYIEDGIESQALSTKPGEGNFHMLPNGVFWVGDEEGPSTVHVQSTAAYIEASHEGIKYATQSGPMLVIDGELHPRFIKDSPSRKIRNGVGITGDGIAVFVLSETPVSFHQFGSLFRDTLGTKNALYLDGTISRIYSKALGRNDKGLPMGPIISVTRRSLTKDSS